MNNSKLTTYMDKPKSLLLRFTDNVETKLLTSSFLYKNSKFLQLCNDNVIDSFAGNDDEANTNNELVYLVCDSHVFLNDDNKYFFNIYDDLFFMFDLSPNRFIALFNALDHLLYTQEYNKKFSKMFITYVLDNNITLNSACFMNNEVRSINNYINNVDIDIQLRVCDITFYEMFFTEYIEEVAQSTDVMTTSSLALLVLGLVIKYDRIDIYNAYIRHSKKHIKLNYYRYVHKYNNELTHIIRNTNGYIKYRKDLTTQLLDKNITLTHIKSLCSFGADLNTTNIDGNNILHLSALRSNLDIIKYLYDYDCNFVLSNIDNQNSIGRTALHYAASNCNVDIILYLINQCNASCNIVDNNGNLPIHCFGSNICLTYAPMCNSTIINKLIGNNINIINNKGETILHCALKRFLNKRFYLIKYLIDIGADTSLQNNDGDTILHYVIYYDNSNKILRYVMKHMVDINVQNNNGITPLDITRQYGKTHYSNTIEEEIYLRSCKL